MAVRSYIAEQLSALGSLQKHAFSEGADAPLKRSVWIIAIDQEERGMLGSGAQARELREAAEADVRLSDHSPFWDQGYRQMSDTIDSLDFSFLAAVTEGLDAALRLL
jgi:hypothetical protein